jgi:DNA repair exonuclease SbcCD ATPase subunit
MPAVRKMASVTRALAQEAARDPKRMERDKLKARLDALQEKDELTEAESAELEKLSERLEALEEEIDKADISDDNATLADMEASLKKYPGAVRALAAEGLTPREYARCMMALLQAAMIEGFSQGKADLSNLPAGVNPANVRFVRENRVELEAIQKEMAGVGKKDR